MKQADYMRDLLATSLKTRIMTAHALCAIAEGHVRTGELERALKSIRAIREMVSEFTVLLSEPHRHSHGAIREARDTLAELETRIEAIEVALPPSGYIH